jgi:hypothetical protein
MAHSLLSPSSSARWLDCGASVKENEKYPNKSNSAADYGTMVHQLGEWLLLDKPLADIGEIVEGVEVDKEAQDLAQDYSNYVRSFLDEDKVLFAERHYDMSFIAPDTGGTADATVINDTTLHVMDLKAGHGIVYAENNPQLMLYALGALHALEDDYYIDEVTLHIVQTRAGHIDSWSCDIDTLLEFEEFAKTQAKAILEGEPEFNPTPRACKWCRHQANCGALAKFTEDVIKGDFEDLEDIDGKANLIESSHIKRILDNKDLITSFIKAVEDEALNKIQNGESIEGFKLVEAVTRKAWDKAEMENIEKYLRRKLKMDGAYKQTVITPTQAVKALGKEGKFIEKWIIKPEGKAVLAPENDKRKSIAPIACDFEEL